MQDYSYGDSSGFTPDSLLIRRGAKPNAEANLRQLGINAKMKWQGISRDRFFKKPKGRWIFSFN